MDNNSTLCSHRLKEALAAQVAQDISLYQTLCFANGACHSLKGKVVKIEFREQKTLLGHHHKFAV